MAERGGSLAHGPACPAPAAPDARVQLGHGSGGRLSLALLRDHLLPRFDDPGLAALADAAVVEPGSREIALSTDTFVVHPLEFPGGNIGHLAVHGTVNDLAMVGAEPRFLTLGLVLEEGLAFELLGRVLDAMAGAARAAGVAVVAGDTKVVERGGADGMFVNTTGVGRMRPDFRPAPSRARAGDRVLVSGPLGRHGIAILAARGDLAVEVDLESDTASLAPLVDRIREAAGEGVRCLRDPTRGGLASALNEIAVASGVGIELDETALPVPEQVQGTCELLGLDPLYVANEGVLAAVVAPDVADACLATLREHPTGAGAALVGRVTASPAGMVVARTALGGSRVVDLLPGAQLPRIC